VFKTTRQSQPFPIAAMVILPDYWHCLWTLPSGTRIFSGEGMISKRDMQHKFSEEKGFQRSA
jgi:putative transposase